MIHPSIRSILDASASRWLCCERVCSSTSSHCWCLLLLCWCLPTLVLESSIMFAIRMMGSFWNLAVESLCLANAARLTLLARLVHCISLLGLRPGKGRTLFLASLDGTDSMLAFQTHPFLLNIGWEIRVRTLVGQGGRGRTLLLCCCWLLLLLFVV